jgi:SRSO17 transposase
VIDETGDRKKGKKTDYVARPYLGSMGKVDNYKIGLWTSEDVKHFNVTYIPTLDSFDYPYP